MENLEGSQKKPNNPDRAETPTREGELRRAILGALTAKGKKRSTQMPE